MSCKNTGNNSSQKQWLLVLLEGWSEFGWINNPTQLIDE
jgi:hypothetical protein